MLIQIMCILIFVFQFFVETVLAAAQDAVVAGCGAPLVPLPTVGSEGDSLVKKESRARAYCDDGSGLVASLILSHKGGRLKRTDSTSLHAEREKDYKSSMDPSAHAFDELSLAQEDSDPRLFVPVGADLNSSKAWFIYFHTTLTKAEKKFVSKKDSFRIYHIAYPSWIKEDQKSTLIAFINGLEILFKAENVMVEITFSSNVNKDEAQSLTKDILYAFRKCMLPLKFL